MALIAILNVPNFFPSPFFGYEFIPRMGLFLSCLLSPLVAWLLSVFIKRRISRPRPAITLSLEKNIQTPPSSIGSFPSAHAATSFSLFFSLLQVRHPLSLPIGIWAFLVSISRVYLGRHYLTDILGGVLIAILSSSLLSFYQISFIVVAAR